MRKIIPFLLSIFVACQSPTNQVNSTNTTGEVQAIKSPTDANSSVPNLSLGSDGTIYMSWIEKNEAQAELRYSYLKNDEWTPSSLISTGDNWFINWADFPALAINSQKQMLAHFLAKSGEGTYAYDVHLTQSTDGGINWGKDFIPHNDSTKSEHGFVSMVPLPDDRFFITWLDGRNTSMVKEPHNHDAYNNSPYAMSLRGAVLDAEGKLSEEFELDNRVCDCCQTGAALTDKGPVVVYRNRSKEEVRDIGIVRYVDGQWTEPAIVYADNWEIAGCPVNGPVATAIDNQLAVVWYSAPNNIASVKVAFSFDAGATFSTPIQVDDLKPLGRVDAVFLDKQTVAVSWMEMVDDHTEIRLKMISVSGEVSQPTTIANISSERASGFPQMVKYSNGLYFAYTATDSISMIKTVKVTL